MLLSSVLVSRVSGVLKEGGIIKVYYTHDTYKRFLENKRWKHKEYRS